MQRNEIWQLSRSSLVKMTVDLQPQRHGKPILAYWRARWSPPIKPASIELSPHFAERPPMPFFLLQYYSFSHGKNDFFLFLLSSLPRPTRLFHLAYPPKVVIPIPDPGAGRPQARPPPPLATAYFGNQTFSRISNSSL